MCRKGSRCIIDFFFVVLLIPFKLLVLEFACCYVKLFYSIILLFEEAHFCVPSWGYTTLSEKVNIPKNYELWERKKFFFWQLQLYFFLYLQLYVLYLTIVTFFLIASIFLIIVILCFRVIFLIIMSSHNWKFIYDNVTVCHGFCQVFWKCILCNKTIVWGSTLLWTIEQSEEKNIGNCYIFLVIAELYLTTVT